MATLRFNKKIYSRAAIDRAAEAYAEVARVSQRTKGAYFEVALDPSGSGDADENLTHEFANYVLYATLVERRA